MKIPYGISNFKSMIEENYLYVDKTKYIELIEKEASKYLFFIRPRRFGKSLFLSTLQNYYDIEEKDNFNKIFGNLYIGKNPTKLRNSYLVLKLNFSGLDTENKERLEYSFNERLKNSAEMFFYRYKKYFKDTEEIEKNISNSKSASGVIETIINEVEKVDKQMYLIIDEYDHFANDIIAIGDGEFYKDIIRASGFVRDFYETIKIGTEKVIDRIFITGISPIMLDDLTSGFNIASNITMDDSLNEALGFTEEEVKEIMKKLDIDEEKIDIKLKEYYNGYLFSLDGRKRVYNPDMILYYFSKYKRNKRFPRELIDDNVKTDYGRLQRLTRNEKNRRKLEEIIKNEEIVTDIVTRFSFDRMYDEEYFVSLLFYMGLLTIDKQYRTKTILRIPNYVIKTIFWEYIEKRLKENYHIKLNLRDLRNSIEDMAYEGKIEPFIDYISENVLKKLSNRDLIGFDEKYIKVILFAYLADSKAYRPISEREVEKGYIDIYLEKDIRMQDVEYEWIIELKYVKKKDKDKLEQIKEEGLKQLERYAKSKGYENKENLKKALVIFIGKEEYTVLSS
ncbi:ATP-binding protein [Caldisalinibacter kiritimatiensis]|uniref:AAA-ATPase-like domain-containing protein n=1 Tax=Caldisalinibacter kiritimatiensis TaxID=1304284 RepID=R1ASG5_9FIRM|nr:ATP-binding protein [Caldisalinibacter kiritimatiensis]EOD00083.1 hypothetical protein L21TH_1849 [Caldisalinibacter kiritimatiensis]